MAKPKKFNHYEFFKEVQEETGLEPNPYAIITPGVLYTPHLSPKAKLFYAVIYSTFDGETGKSDVSDYIYSVLMRVSMATIKKWLAELEEEGYIEIEQKGKKRYIVVQKRHD